MTKETLWNSLPQAGIYNFNQILISHNNLHSHKMPFEVGKKITFRGSLLDTSRKTLQTRIIYRHRDGKQYNLAENLMNFAKGSLINTRFFLMILQIAWGMCLLFQGVSRSWMVNIILDFSMIFWKLLGKVTKFSFLCYKNSH